MKVELTSRVTKDQTNGIARETAFIAVTGHELLPDVASELTNQGFTTIITEPTRPLKGDRRIYKVIVLKYTISEFIKAIEFLLGNSHDEYTAFVKKLAG